jgi:hypothetical protein
MSLGPYAGNPDQNEDQNADEHEDDRYLLLAVGGAQAAIVDPVISDSGRALFCMGGRISAVTQVPRFLAVTPRTDLGSGN